MEYSTFFISVSRSTWCRYLRERRAILAAKQDALAKLYAAKAEECKKVLSAGEGVEAAACTHVGIPECCCV
jgi:hypothetical protein